MERLQPTSSERPEDRHEDGLCLGSAITLVALSVLAHDDRGPDFPLGVVVVRWDMLMVQEGEDVLLEAAKSFDNALDVMVRR